VKTLVEGYHERLRALEEAVLSLAREKDEHQKQIIYLESEYQNQQKELVELVRRFAHIHGELHDHAKHE